MKAPSASYSLVRYLDKRGNYHIGRRVEHGRKWDKILPPGATRHIRIPTDQVEVIPEAKET